MGGGALTLAELTPPPILNAIAEQPALLTSRVWSRYFQSIRDQVMALTTWTEGLLATTPPPAIAPTSAAGSAETAARGDHTHGGGVTLSSTVPPAIAATGAVGTASEAARSDHTHAAMVTTFQAQIDALNARLTALEQPQLSKPL